MNNFTETKNDFDLTNLLFFFIKWWKHLGVIVLAAAIAGAVFSSPLFITPLFEAKVVVFPAQTQSISRAIFDLSLDFTAYGGVGDAERLMQVLGSAAVRDRVVEHFDLYEHYEITEDSKYRETELKLTYGGNVTANRTMYGAVEIIVRDKEPEMAANMANYIAAVVDTIKNELRRERFMLAYEAARQNYESIQSEIVATEDTLSAIMEKGIYHYEAQADRLTQQLAIDISANNRSGINELEERLEVIERYGAQFMLLRTHLNQVTHNLYYAQRSMQQAKINLDNFNPYSIILDQAVVPEKDVYPVRMIIVFFFAFAAGLIGIVALMTYELFVRKGIIKLKVK